MRELAFCDYNAGAPTRPEAIEAVARALGEGGNPSAVHRVGRRAKATIETARERAAEALGAAAQDVIFTSGATEALHLAMDAARGAGVRDLIVCAIEHDAVIEHAARMWPGYALAPVGADGAINLAALESLLRARPGAMVALMLANNETGALQPVAEASRLVREAGGVLLVDAAQALGRIAVDRNALDATYLVVSSHKVGGPPGVGALALAPGAPFASPRAGGGQERGRRPGTENVAGVAGFGAAVVAATRAREAEAARVGALRDAFENELRRRWPEAVVFVADVARLANTSLFALSDLTAETAVIGLDLESVAISAGAACSSGKVRANRVLTAMGVAPALAACALRASFGWASREEDVERLLDGLDRVRLRAGRRVKGAA